VVVACPFEGGHGWQYFANPALTGGFQRAVKSIIDLTNIQKESNLPLNEGSFNKNHAVLR
jgi:hypothetical protein